MRSSREEREVCRSMWCMGCFKGYRLATKAVDAKAIRALSLMRWFYLHPETFLSLLFCKNRRNLPFGQMIKSFFFEKKYRMHHQVQHYLMSR